MPASTAQLNLSQSTLEEIALNALLLQAFGLEVDEAIISRVGQAPLLPQGINARLSFSIGDLEPSIVWK